MLTRLFSKFHPLQLRDRFLQEVRDVWQFVRHDPGDAASVGRAVAVSAGIWLALHLVSPAFGRPAEPAGSIGVTTVITD